MSLSNAEFSHRGYEMVCTDEQDGEGFCTPAYIAWRPSERSPRGESLLLSHPRFDFEPTADWFCGEVDRVLGDAA